MFDSQSLEESQSGLVNLKQKNQPGKITKGFFISDIADYDQQIDNQQPQGPQSPSSPTKMLKKQKTKNVKDSFQSSSKGFRKNKIKLQPLQKDKPRQIIFDEGLDEIQLEVKQQNKYIYKNESDNDDELKDISLNSDVISEKKLEGLLQQQDSNINIAVQQNKEKQFQHIKGFQTLKFLIKRDQKWLNKLRPQFNIHYKANNEYFFSAKMTGNNATLTFIMSRSKEDFTENGPHYLGKVKSNFVGNQVCIYGPGYNPTDSKQKKLPLREMRATVVYETNFFGSTKPRNFKVYALRPLIKYYQLFGTKQFDEEKPLSELYKFEENKKFIYVLINKKPQWNDEVGGYMLNFGGKVKKASRKNFILQDDDNSENNRMLFGKIDEDQFRMEIGNPMSPLVGFGIALSAFGSKIGCQ